MHAFIWAKNRIYWLPKNISVIVNIHLNKYSYPIICSGIMKYAFLKKFLISKPNILHNRWSFFFPIKIKNLCSLISKASTLTQLKCDYLNKPGFCNQCFYLFIYLFIYLPFSVPPVAYGSSQAMGPIRTAAAILCHSHSKEGSELHLQLTP